MTERDAETVEFLLVSAVAIAFLIWVVSMVAR